MEEGLWHVGGEIKTNEEVALEIAKHFPKVNVEYIEPKHKRGILRQSLNYDKIKKAVGWKPKVNFKEGIKRTVDWWLR